MKVRVSLAFVILLYEPWYTCIPFAVSFVKCTSIKDKKFSKNARRYWYRNNVSYSQPHSAILVFTETTNIRTGLYFSL
jgi:hypothetical protein